MLDRWSSLLESRLPRGAGLAAAALVIVGEPRLWRGQGRSRSRRRRRHEGCARSASAMPPASASYRSRSPAITTSAARKFSPSPASPAPRRSSSSTSIGRASGSRPIRGSPTPPCSSSTPASCRSASRSARPSRCGKRTATCPSSPTTAPCSSPMWRPTSSGCRWWSGAGRRRERRSSSPLLDRHPAMRDFVRAVGPGRRAALEPAAQERHRRAASGSGRCRRRSRRLVELDREKNLITRDIVAIDLRLPDRVTVRLSDAAAQARIDALKDKPKKKGGNA